MFILSQIYNAFTTCYGWAADSRCCRRAAPKPPLPSNEAIQERLASQDPDLSDKKLSEFWDNYTSPNDAGPPDYLVQSLLPSIQPGKAYDVGAGIGDNTRLLLSQKWKVTAVDISPKAIAILKSLKDTNLETVESTLEGYAFPKKASLIVATNVLAFCRPSHVKKIWDRMHDALKKDGYLVCTLPIPNGGNYAFWEMSRKEAEQFFFKGKYVVRHQWESDDPFTDHPLSLILQKV